MRDVPEWIGKTDSTPVPARVRLRVFDRDGGICQCGCGIKVRAGMPWQTDHIVAIANGGENRESNLRTLLDACHKEKTATDIGIKSKVATKRKKILGIHQSRNPLPGSKRSKWKRKMDGTIVKR